MFGARAPGPGPDPPPGWYPDPWEQASGRWWGGAQWTPHTPSAEGRPTAPAAAGSAGPTGSDPSRRGMPAGVIVAVVLGVLVLAGGGGAAAFVVLGGDGDAGIDIAAGGCVRYEQAEYAPPEDSSPGPKIKDVVFSDDVHHEVVDVVQGSTDPNDCAASSTRKAYVYTHVPMVICTKSRR